MSFIELAPTNLKSPEVFLVKDPVAAGALFDIVTTSNPTLYDLITNSLIDLDYIN